MKYFINNGNTTDVLLYSFLKSEVKQILNQLFTFFTAYKMAYVCIEYIIIIIIITGCLPFFCWRSLPLTGVHNMYLVQ